METEQVASKSRLRIQSQIQRRIGTDSDTRAETQTVTETSTNIKPHGENWILIRNILLLTNRTSIMY